MDLSVVIPCLNESETLKICIQKAKNKINELGIKGEIIISDNGSTDGSQEIAKDLGAKIFNASIKGYGAAVNNGIKNSVGKYILIADGDDSYNFDDLPIFYNKIKEGYDLVQGCRLPSGGGTIEKDAMPITHRLIGNPMFSSMVKLFYNVKFNDVYCGMKIIRNDFFKETNFFSTGMVFCLEILIKSKIMNAKVSEVPITLFKDGRINAKSHLKTIKDGLKTLKFILISSPKWSFFIPSFISLIFSFITLLLIKTNNTESVFLVLTLSYLSFQLFMLGLFSKIRSVSLGLSKMNWLNNFFKLFSLRISFIISFISIIFGFFSLYLNLDLIGKEIDFMIYYFSIFFGVSLIANSLTISLLFLNE